MTPWWRWLGFIAFVLVLLAFDLGVLHRHDRAITVRHALWLSLGYLVLALLFAAGLFAFLGRAAGYQFLTGYLIEKSLSIDSIFVFVLIFSHFAVPPQYQYRVLFWGILGALVGAGQPVQGEDGAAAATVKRPGGVVRPVGWGRCRHTEEVGTMQGGIAMHRLRYLVQTALIAAVLALAAGPAALAQEEDRRGNIDRMVERLTRELDLTAEQQATIRAAFQAHQEEFRSLHQRIREERRALIQTLQAGEGYDPDAVAARAQAIGDSLAEMIQLMAGVHAEVASELTAEQRQRLARLLLSNRMGGGGGGGGKGR